MCGCDILCGILKGIFEIPHKISYPYIERCVFDIEAKFQEFFGLGAGKCIWNGPKVNKCKLSVYIIYQTILNIMCCDLWLKFNPEFFLRR